MGRFIVGVIVGICLVAGSAYLYFSTGMAPVAATAPPMPFEQLLANDALRATMKKEAPKSTPVEATKENLMAGAEIYKQNCAFCHGQSATESSIEGTGMFPPAPQLFHPDEMVTDDAPGVIYWKVKNGIRLTGMPSFEKFLSNQQMWEVSLVLHDADKLPPEASAVLATHPSDESAKPGAGERKRQ